MRLVTWVSFKGSQRCPRRERLYKLGKLYETAKCHHSAVESFGRTLSLARDAGATERILENLYRLAQNLENLGLYEQAGPYYGEILEMMSGAPVQQRPESASTSGHVRDRSRGSGAWGSAHAQPDRGHAWRTDWSPLTQRAARGLVPCGTAGAGDALCHHRAASGNDGVGANRRGEDRAVP